MLEINHVSKTYRPKKGVPVTALDDVSLSFADTGLVFILGKSGSGKSTLLNVIGGLDRADAGEFVIKGKSSRNFSTSDFDAYRNTFIGFIFQEYNILSEFSVGQNIALAMELQGKKASNEKLNEILETVDLVGYAGRKPAELSGGQKQRVAIARALVKEPEIIMADEPTGALDSATGKQVFDTLKKLSETKLVIVVSHDREFAEYYGDRVIELADGKIISDITKYEAAPNRKSAGVSIIDDKILHIKKGYALTAQDLSVINDYLTRQTEDTIISADPQANGSFKQIAMIDDEGNKSSFKNTARIEKTEAAATVSETKFIKSRLPYKNALKIGASSLKTKPVRLFFTIILSVFAFALFGLADTMAAYNKYSTATQTITDRDIPYAAFTVRQDTATVGDYVYTTEFGASKSAKKLLEEKTGIDYAPVYNGGNYYNVMSLPGIGSGGGSSGSSYDIKNCVLADLGKSQLDAMGYSVSAGRLPIADDEIAITKYASEIYRTAGLLYQKENDNPGEQGNVTVSIPADKLTPDDNDETGIFNKPLILVMSEAEMTVKIVGIVDTKLDSKYDVLKQPNEGSFILAEEFRAEIEKGIHGMVFTNAGVVEKIVESQKKLGGYAPGALDVTEDYGLPFDRLVKVSQIPTDGVIWNESGKTSLQPGEILLPLDEADRLPNYSEGIASLPAREFYDVYWDDFTDDFQTLSVGNSEGLSASGYAGYLKKDVIARYVKSHGVPAEYLADYDLTGLEPGRKKESYAQYLCYVSDDQESGYYRNPYELSTGASIYLPEITKFWNDYNIIDLNNLSRRIYNTGRDSDAVKAVGWYATDDMNGGKSVNTICVDDACYDLNNNEFKGSYSSLIGVMPKNASDVNRLVNFTYDFKTENGVSFMMRNAVMTSLENVNGMIEKFAGIFLYIGLGLAAFAGLLLANFIAVSIANKKREIGILRAVGAKSSDVFMIFINESSIITLINFVLALVTAIGVTILLNSVLGVQIGLSLLTFGIRQVAVLFGVSVGVAVLASFFPVYAIARKQPIESIRSV